MNTSRRMVLIGNGLALRAAYMNVPNSKALDRSVPAVHEWFRWSENVPDEIEHYVMETHDRLFDEVNARF